MTANVLKFERPVPHPQRRGLLADIRRLRAEGSDDNAFVDELWMDFSASEWREYSIYLDTVWTQSQQARQAYLDGVYTKAIEILERRET